MIGVVTTLGLVISQMSIEHLAFSSLKANRQSALDLARSAASMAIAKLSQDPEFGTRPNTPILQANGERAQDRGEVIFDQVLANQAGIPYSYNNLLGTAAKPGSLGNSIPQSSVHLVAVGHAAGQIRRIEVALALPPFPFAVASSGPIRAIRGVQIAGLKALPIAGSTISPDAAGLTEADLASNDATPNAIFLGPGTKIQGSVQAVGNISLDPSAPKGSIEVLGSIKSSSDHESIPSQQLSKYDPLISGDDYTAIEAPTLSHGGNRLGGRLRRDGSLEVQDGLQLDGCLLFVDGDLKVFGGLTGKGVVVATGKIQLDGQSKFESGNGLAILSGQDTTISGSGPQGSYFQGIVYTQGRFSADRVTLVGSLIADNERQRSPVSLTDSRVLTTPNPVVRVDLPPSQPGGPTPPVDPRIGPSLGSFQMNVFDRETGYRSVLQVQLNQGDGGLWLQVGPAPAEFVDDPALISDRITQSIPNGFSYQPIKPQLDPIVANYDPGWKPPATTDPDPQSAAVITIDPSSFLKLQERMRVVSWREDR
jgi:hypothetical protein